MKVGDLVMFDEYKKLEEDERGIGVVIEIDDPPLRGDQHAAVYWSKIGVSWEIIPWLKKI